MAHRCPHTEYGQLRLVLVVLVTVEKGQVTITQSRWDPHTVRHLVTELPQPDNDVPRCPVELTGHREYVPSRDRLTGIQPRSFRCEVATQKHVVVILDGLRHERSLEGVPKRSQTTDHLTRASVRCLGHDEHLPERHGFPGGQPSRVLPRLGHQQALGIGRQRELQMVGPADAECFESRDHVLRRPFQLPSGEQDMPERHRLRGTEPGGPAVDAAAQHQEVVGKDLLRYRLSLPQEVPEFGEPGSHLSGAAAHPLGNREHVPERHRLRRIHPAVRLQAP